MILMDTARKLNRHIKKKKKEKASKYLSLVRRIERTAPLTDRRVAAITFDDGPSAAVPSPTKGSDEKGLTSVLLDILKDYNAKGTFDVIGTTDENYPDKQGRLDTAHWGGIKYDHYPDFGKDKLAGVVNQPELARRIISEGHELVNHTYSHILFGPIMLIYGKRVHLDNIDAVVDDLRKLHDFVKSKLNYEVKLSRPPHYIDNIPGGFSSYDAYSIMGYNYLAASFDGGGWKPSSGNYKKDVEEMVAPLEKALLSDPNSLNGQIIFHKDGYNMSRQTPVVDALPKHLQLLKDNGYEIVTASELIRHSPYEDVPQADDDFEAIKALEQTGYCVGYKDNTFKPDNYLTMGELAMMVTPPQIIQMHHKSKCSGASAFGIIGGNKELYSNISKNHPYFAGIAHAVGSGLLGSSTDCFNPDAVVDRRTFEKFLDKAAEGIDLKWSSTANSPLKRRDICEVLLSYINQLDKS